MAHTCLSICALCSILITFVAVAISFSCPEWEYSVRLGGDKSAGLWLDCRIREEGIRWECDWYFAKDFSLQKKLPAWFIAVQVLYSVALAFSVMAVIAASCTCMSRSNRANSVTCGLINFTFLLLVAAVATYGAMKYTREDMRASGSLLRYGWVYWVAVGATGMSLISTILYYCLSRVEDFGHGYKD